MDVVIIQQSNMQSEVQVDIRDRRIFLRKIAHVNPKPYRKVKQNINISTCLRA